MQYKRYQSFDLDEKRPNVLLLGNGILKSCDPTSAKSWEEYIFDIANNSYTVKAKKQLKNAPYSIQAMTVSGIEDGHRQQQYIECFPTLTLHDDRLLKDLLACPFDAILTTNYSYELENVFLKSYSNLKSKLPYVYCTKEKRDYKRLLHTYNQIGNSPPIWHIHGELRAKSSIVLTHDEYARLICDVLNYNKNNQNRYQNFEEDLKFYSWIDYLIMGNVYVLGQGFDFLNLIFGGYYAAKKEKMLIPEIFTSSPRLPKAQKKKQSLIL